ncbi:MAG: hypothetical protein ACO3FN_02840, partial [Vulcanococcus sp.]
MASGALATESTTHGELALVLHAHLPYVHSSEPGSLEEDWYFQALLECYLPLLDVLETAAADPAQRPRLSMGLSPTLLSLLSNRALSERFGPWLAVRQELLLQAPAGFEAAAADLAQQEEILRVNRAVTEIQSLLETGDMLPAARLWLETNERSPARLGNYKEQLLPRILNGYSAGAVRQLLARIERRDILDDPKASQAAPAETLEVMRVGRLLGVPEDAAWKQLLEIKGRTLLLPTLDVRPVLAVPGRWRVSALGPKSPVEAEFPLSRSAVDRLTKWAEEAGASSRSTAQIRLRVLPLVRPHQRDERTPYVNGE